MPRLDPSFNGAGVALATGDFGGTVALDVDGRIVVMGRDTTGQAPRLALWRFTGAGVLDPSFGAKDGARIPDALPIANGPDGGQWGQAMLIDPKGRIVVAGYAIDREGRLHLVLWRFTSDGMPDSEFHGGVVTRTASLGIGDDDIGKDVAVDAHGRIVVAGSAWSVDRDGNPREHLALWRFTEAGAPDSSLHGDGVLTVADARGNGLALDAQERMLVVGAALLPRGQWTMAVWRFQPDGSSDPE